MCTMRSSAPMESTAVTVYGSTGGGLEKLLRASRGGGGAGGGGGGGGGGAGGAGGGGRAPRWRRDQPRVLRPRDGRRPGLAARCGRARGRAAAGRHPIPAGTGRARTPGDRRP